jgi:hypothetical protein
LPPAFEPSKQALGNEVVQILEDIHALQHLIETTENVDRNDPVSIAQLDNHQAWIKSRLQKCLAVAENGNGMLVSCILASYLYAYMLFTGIWAAVFIPAKISGKLLRVLECVNVDTSWKGHEDIFFWCVGGDRY